MGLHLHRAERTDVLADGLAAVLAEPLADPFAMELVLVPARGVERWLSQRLSHLLGQGATNAGVCAGIEFRNPHSLIAELTGSAAEDPWSPDALVWPLLEVIDENIDASWCLPLANHLGRYTTGDAEREFRLGRRYAVARRIAGLFASYARQRPRLLVDWLDGDDTALPADVAWQPPLWRALAAGVPADPPHLRHAKTIARLQESPSDLPPRLSLFGHTRLPATEIELIEALAVHHDIHLWLPHASDHLWRALATERGAIRRRDDTSHRAVGHPLLATLGRDLRELQRSLPTTVTTDEHLPATTHPATLLGWLQSDIAANTVRGQGRTLDRSDRSVQVHACHSEARQVDVLREVLLGLLADDVTLEPRDILVMCPDIETYAPLINADFGLGDVVAGAHPAHRLRMRLADRALVQTNPLLGVATQLLSLAGGRVTASEVLNLAQTAPVRARFGFTDDNLEDITRWVRQANIRWGFDREHRLPYGVDFVHNTWRFGTDRVLAGVAISDDAHAWLYETMPLDDVSSNRVELAGRLAEFVDRLQRTVAALNGAQPLRDWITALTDGIVGLTRTPDADAWQFGQLEREFADVLSVAGPRDTTELRLSDVRALLERRLAGRPTRANFRTGTMTVCTMVPMRSVPHRVVCLVGLDDGVFPRHGHPDGDDVLGRDPMTGERDHRSEDRQLLLDAIGAATEKLVITYTGANAHSGRPRPPAVPLAELLDSLYGTTETPAQDVHRQVEVHHPLQPFDIRNVQPGELVPDVPFTFDSTVLKAARSGAGRRTTKPPFISGALAPPPADDVALADLVGFFRDPVKGFFRALDYTLPWDVDGVTDDISVEVDALEEWTVGDRMLADLLRGMSVKEAMGAEWRRGTLPPGQLGWRKALEISDRAALLAAEAIRYRNAAARAFDVDVDLGAGRRLTGTVSPVFGDRLVSVTYSKLGGKHLLESWIPLLALYARDPSTEWEAVCIGRNRRGNGPEAEGLGRPEGSPVDLLRDLVDLYDAGRSEPLPLPVKTSYAWASARHTGDDPEGAARYRWVSGRYPAEDKEPAHVQAWGADTWLSDLMQPLRDGEGFEGETNRLGAYSCRLWMPLLRAKRSPS